MKFILSEDGSTAVKTEVINTVLIFVDKKYYVNVRTDNYDYTMAEFDSEDAAKKYLSELVAELNGGTK